MIYIDYSNWQGTLIPMPSITVLDLIGCRFLVTALSVTNFLALAVPDNHLNFTEDNSGCEGAARFVQEAQGEIVDMEENLIVKEADCTVNNCTGHHHHNLLHSTVCPDPLVKPRPRPSQ